MSKSKSRHPSKATSGSSKNGASGVARQPSAAAKATVKGAVGDSATTTEKATSTATTARQVPAASAATKSMPSTLPPTQSKAQSRDSAKYERRQAERQSRLLAQRRARRNKILAWTSAVLIVAVIGGLGYWIYQSHLPTAAKAATSPSAYQEPIYNSSYPPVENVYCDSLEQSVMHIHAHVSIYIDGKLEDVPQYVGIPQDSSGNVTCYYWLHTHDTSGIIHMESPVQETFTFGQFLDEWNTYFNSLGFYPQLLLKSGWTIWINGKQYNGTLDSIPMTAHALITVAYNSPKVKPDTTYNWGNL